MRTAQNNLPDTVEKQIKVKSQRNLNLPRSTFLHTVGDIIDAIQVAIPSLVVHVLSFSSHDLQRIRLVEQLACLPTKRLTPYLLSTRIRVCVTSSQYCSA